MTDEQEVQMNEIPSNDLVEEWLETHLTPEINTELTQMRDDWEKERQEYLKRFITNPGNLTQYQRARGIDTSKRKRIG